VKQDKPNYGWLSKAVWRDSPATVKQIKRDARRLRRRIAVRVVAEWGD